MRKLVVATGNAGKLAEFQQLLADSSITVIGQRELGVGDVPETGLSFVENALIKARHACGQSGFAALADDSGLAVDALEGAPGIYSSRYAGDDASDAENMAKLLRTLADVPDPQRTARFCCVLVLMRSAADPMPLICQGQWPGRILRTPRGGGGFGYDPVFLPEAASLSAAEMRPQDKNRQSHRGRALRALQALLSEQ